MQSSICLTLSLVFVLSASEACARKWTDITGKYSVEAALLDVRDETVRLKKSDGSVVSVPLARLSRADREFALRARATTEQPEEPARADTIPERPAGPLRSPAEPPPVDLVGDPLPPAAISRLGTDRWRHVTEIRAMAFSPDGRLFALAGHDVQRRDGLDDYSIRVLDAHTGKVLRELPGHVPGVQVLTFSVQGDLLASAGYDGTCRVSDLADGTIRWSFHCVSEETSLHPVAPSQDLREPQAVQSEQDRDVANQSLRFSSSFGGGHGVQVPMVSPRMGKSACSQLQFSHDGKHLFAKLGAMVYALDVETGALVRKLQESVSKQLGTFYNFRTGDLFQAERECGGHVTLASDGKTMVAVLRDGTLLRRDVLTGKELSRVKFHAPGISLTHGDTKEKQFPLKAIRCSSDSSTVYLATEDVVVSWDTVSGQTRKVLAKSRLPEGARGTPGPLWATMAFSANGKSAALSICIATQREVLLFPAADGQPPRSVRLASPDGLHVALSADGKRLATNDLNRVRLWNTETGAELPSSEGHEDVIHAVVFSPDGATLATGGTDSTARLWETRTGRQLHHWLRRSKSQGFYKHSIAFSADGKTLAIGHGKEIDLVSCTSGRTITTLGKEAGDSKETNRGQTPAVTFSRDGRCLLSWDDHNKVLRTWDVETGAMVRETPIDIMTRDRPLRTAKVWVTAAEPTFSAAGRLLTASQFAGLVKFVWDTDTGKRRLKQYQLCGFTSACFSPDEKLVAIGSQDGRIQIIDTETSQTIREFAVPHLISFPRAFLDDGRILVSDHYDNSTRFWDVANGKEVCRLDGHRIRACSSDGRYAASVSGSHVVLTWDLAQVAQIPALHNPD